MQRPSSEPVVLVNLLLEPSNRLTGISRYAFFLLESLVRLRKYRFVVATTWALDQLPDVFRHDSVEVRTFPHSRFLMLNALRQSVLIRRLMAETGAALEFNPCTIGGLAGDWPQVLTVHDLYFKTEPSLYKMRHRLWWNILFPLTARRASRIVCVSHATQADLARHHPSAARRSTVIHSASGFSRSPDIRRPDLDATPEAGPFGLFVCNVSPNKGAGTLLAAMQILAARGRQVDIRHVGNDVIGAFAAAGSVRPQPLGVVSDEALRDLYRRAAFLVFPSYAEGFGLPILEAQTFGVPVIASDIPVLREVGGAGAVYFERANAVQLADRIAALSDDAAHRSRLSQAAVENARLFSWEKAAQDLARVFDESMATKPVAHGHVSRSVGAQT